MTDAALVAHPIHDDASPITPARARRHVPRPSVPLEEADLAAVRALIAATSLTEAARRLDVARTTLAPVAAGAAVREGTRLVISQRLRAIGAR